MNIETLKLIRNILWRTALISVILLLVSLAATLALWDWWTATTAAWFHTQASQLGALMVNWFALAKLYVWFVLIAPALALQWEINRRQKA